MEKRPCISVVMPVYDSGAFICEAIDSLLEQTFKDFELIIVDETLDEEVSDKIKYYTDFRINYIKKAYTLQSVSLFKAVIEQANGKFIAAMDANCICFSNRLEKQYYYLKNHEDLLAVGTECLLISMDNNKITPKTYKEILLALLKCDCFIYPSLMFRLDAFTQLSKKHKDYHYSLDYNLICHMILLGKIENLQEPLIKYSRCLSELSVLDKKEKKQLADGIRRGYQLAFIRHFMNEEQLLIEEVDVGHLDMGLIIGYYTYAHYTGDISYELLAEKLVDEVFENTSVLMPICSENGLLGVGFGLIYLIRNNFLNGEEDVVLKSVDRLLFRSLIDLVDELVINWYDWLHYLRLRICHNYLPEKKIYNMILQQYGIYMLDSLMRGLEKGLFLSEQILLEVKEYHQMKLYQKKTAEILEIKSTTDTTIIPLHSFVCNDEVSFVIPLRIDSDERARNLDLLLEELTTIRNAKILILEGDKRSTYFLKKNYLNVVYQFIEDFDPIFHRTKYLNLLLKAADTDIVGIWDTDVMIPEAQILDAMREIRRGKAIMSFPYDGHFYMLSPSDSDLFGRKNSYDRLKEQGENQLLVHGPHSVGGAFFVNKKAYMQIGGENEHFYGWGPEDTERVKRIEILGLPVYRSEGSLFHLYHPRNENSWYGSPDLELQNRQEFLKVCSMTREELQRYIQTWEWLPTYK